MTDGESTGYRPLAVASEVRAHTKEWFAQLRERAFGGEGYVLCYPNAPHEIFEALEIPFVVDAWYSGLAGAKQLGGRYSRTLESHGYHAGLLRYMAMPFAAFLEDDPATAPWGGLPLPRLVVSGSASDHGSALATRFDVPHVVYHTPAERRPHNRWWEYARYEWEGLVGSDRIDYVVDQYRELIAQLERIWGRRLDMDRLRAVMARVNEQEEHLRRIRDMMASAPKLPVRLGEVTTITMGIQWHRGSEWAVRAAESFAAEVQQRVDDEAWVCPDEKYRLMWLGTGLWQNQGFLDEFERDHGAVFVRSNYLSLAADGYAREGLADPLRPLASRYATHGADSMHQPGPGSAWALEEARLHRVDGALLVGQWWAGSRLIARDLEDAGIPVATLEADSLGTGTMDTEALKSAVAEFINVRIAQQTKGEPS